MKPSAGIVIGNPKVSDFSEEITLSPEGNPVTTRYYSFDNMLEFDTMGNAFFNVVRNFYQTCKVFRHVLESKRENVTKDSYMTALNQMISATENFDLIAKTMSLKATELSIHGGKIIIDSPEIILGNDLNVDEDEENENKFEGNWDGTNGIKYSVDSVMTVGKFKLFFRDKILPYLNKLKTELEDKYNNHTHIYIAGQTPNQLTTKPSKYPTATPDNLYDVEVEDEFDSATKIDSLRASKTLKTY